MSRYTKHLARKGSRYDTYFYGDNEGRWIFTDKVIWGRRGYDWEMLPSMSARNDWRNFSVEGAVESNAGFRKALREIVEEYPEVREFIFSFDGPYVPAVELLRGDDKFSWQNTRFFHGTSTALLDKIRVEGLRPRLETGGGPSYGTASSAREGSVDAVYLTTQWGMASFAARDAARAHGGEPVVLEVVGLDERYVLPDEDSREEDARRSLDSIGSIRYIGRVSPDMIKGAHVKGNKGRYEG